MIQFRLYYDKDKETEYLNEMSRRGYAMTGFFAGIYHFDSCSPGEYIYQIDITEGLFRVSNDYREFMRDMEVEIVCLWGPWVILRKRAAAGPFVLYTDVESSIAHYKKIRRTFKVVLALEILVLLVELVAALQGAGAAWAFFFMIAAFAVAFVRQLIHVNRILAELGERSRNSEFVGQGRKLSLFLPAGLLLNGAGLMIPESGAGNLGHIAGFLKGLIQGLALVFMIFGIWMTLWRRGD